MGLDKYMYALGRGIRGVKQALDDVRAEPDPRADRARRDAGGGGFQPACFDCSHPEPPPLPREPLALGARTLVMGVVNVTRTRSRMAVRGSITPPPSPMANSFRARAPTFSISAANPHAPTRRPSRQKTKSRASFPSSARLRAPRASTFPSTR